MTDRRSFMNGVAAALIAMTAVADSYDLRCRMWMWGHHPDSMMAINGPLEKHGLSSSNHVDMADGCRLMGIPNVCVIRWKGLPKPPFDAYIRQFAGMREVAWSITDSDGTLSFAAKVDVALAIKRKLPNLTTVYLDDYFQKYLRPLDELKAARDKVHAAGMKLAAVMYADVEGLRESDLPSARLCDSISLWFWSPDSFGTMERDVLRAKAFLGEDMPILLGIYMWDFGKGAGPVPPEKMKQQLEVAGRLLKSGKVAGLIFHPTFCADMDIPSVNLAKQWIRALP